MPLLGSTGYKISLVSATPGTLVRVSQNLARAIRKQTGAAPICFLQLFGKYDICAIYRTKDFTNGPSKSGGIENIRGSNQIFAFPWRSGRKVPSRPLRHSNKRITALLFFRINESLAARYGTIIEQALAQTWAMRRMKKVKIDVLGTVGWAELIFIVRGNKFSDVISALTAIGGLKVEVESAKGRTEDLFSAKTFTLIGIDFNLVKKTHRGRLKTIFAEDINSGESLYPRLNITCPPGDMKELLSVASKSIGNPFYSYGSVDLSFDSTKCKSWGDFIIRVLDLREGLKNRMYSTSIHILHKNGSHLYPKVQSTVPKRSAVNVPMDRIQLFDDWGPTISSRLTNLSFGISNLLQDPLVGDCFSDLRSTIERRLPDCLATMDSKVPALQNFIGETIEYINYALVERAHGAFLALEYPQSFSSPTKGGIQRVLKSVSAVAESVLGRAGIQWRGFVVTGFRDLSFSSHLDIVNIPTEFLFKPEQWWGLFHEFGHIAMFEKVPVDLFSLQEVTRMVPKETRGREDSYTAKKTKRFISELGADSFDLYFCHRSDFVMYLCHIWPYLIKRGYRLDHFVRYFSMFQYWKYLLEPSRSSFPTNLNMDDEVAEFKLNLRRLKLTYPKDPSEEDAAKRLFLKYSKVIEALHRSYQRQHPVGSLRQEMQDRNLKSAVSTVMSGKVFVDRIQKPDLFILALKQREGVLKFDNRLAAILSLWHTATTRH